MKGQETLNCVQKVDIDIVQATIKNPETKKALLVYASEKAVAHSRQPLPSQLRVRYLSSI